MKEEEKEHHIHFTCDYTKSTEGGFVGVINEVPGVVSYGETMEELTENLYDALITMFKFNVEKSDNLDINRKKDWSTTEIPLCPA